MAQGLVGMKLSDILERREPYCEGRKEMDLHYGDRIPVVVCQPPGGVGLQEEVQPRGDHAELQMGDKLGGCRGLPGERV